MQTYTVKVTIAPSSQKTITSYAFLSAINDGLNADVTATISGTTITATVPFGTDVTALVATFGTTGASVMVGAVAQTSGVSQNDFTNPVTYTVVAADNSTQSYTVSISIAPSSAKNITAYAFPSAENPGLANDAIGSINGTQITVTVPTGTVVTALVAAFTSTGQTVYVGSTMQASGETANDFTNPVTYTVTAADMSTQSYTVTVMFD
jgi:hypothetical protein